jgi:hypothetical protein
MVLFLLITVFKSTTMVRLLYIVLRAEGTHAEVRAIVIYIASYNHFAVRVFLRRPDNIF